MNGTCHQLVPDLLYKGTSPDIEICSKIPPVLSREFMEVSLPIIALVSFSVTFAEGQLQHWLSVTRDPKDRVLLRNDSW